MLVPAVVVGEFKYRQRKAAPAPNDHRVPERSRSNRNVGGSGRRNDQSATKSPLPIPAKILSNYSGLRSVGSQANTKK